MPRNMSFSFTTEQVRNRTKTVTRRDGWWFLKSGDIINAVEKGMGLKKGEKIKRICQLRILSTRKERLESITDEDVVREGFPGWSRSQFVDMFCKSHGVCGLNDVNRIEFEYI